MANIFTKFIKGILLKPETSDASDNLEGSLFTNSTDNKIKAYIQGGVREVVMHNQTQTLTNKTLDADQNSLSNIDNADIKAGAAIDATKIADGSVTNAEFQYVGGLTSDAQTQIDSKASAASLSAHTGASSGVHGVTGSVVGTSDSQVLTNKTIDADLSTITNIKNADIKVGAAIDASKIADGSVSNAEFQALNGVAAAIVDISSSQVLTNKTIDGDDNTVQDLALSSLKTVLADANKVLERDASGIVVSGQTKASSAYVGISDSQTLTNKTLDVAKVDNGLDFIEEASLSSPASGHRRLAAKTDGKLYLRDSSGNERAIATGNSLGINYITNNDAETDTSGWVRYADAAASRPVDGTGGSPNAAFTFTADGTNTLRGAKSFLITKDANNRQGHGVSYDFSIDSADQSKLLEISFDYAASDNFVAGSSSADSDVIVYIYDVTNTTLIEPSNFKILGKGQGLEFRYKGFFQTSKNSSSYRLILHVASTNASSYTLKFDNVKVGPSDALSQDSQLITAKVTRITSAQTLANTTATKIQFNSVDYDSVGGWDVVTNYRFTIPVAGTYKLSGAIEISADTNGARQISYRKNGGSDILLSVVRSAGSVATVVSFSTEAQFLAGDYIELYAYQDSGSTLNIDQDVSVFSISRVGAILTGPESRVVALEQFGTPSSSLTGSLSDIVWGTSVSNDTHGAYNDTTGEFTVPIEGHYKVTSRIRTNGTLALNNEVVLVLLKNGSEVARSNQFAAAAVTELNLGLESSVKCVAGDVLKLQASSGATGPGFVSSATGNFLCIARESGPDAITPSETIAARYKTSAGQSMGDGVFTIVNFDTSEFDTHGTVTTGASWKFTAPVAGLYQISSVVAFAANATGARQVDIYKNGSQYTSLALNSPGSAIHGISGSTAIRLIAGDYIDLRGYQNSGGSLSLHNSDIFVHVTIIRIGN